MAKRRSSKSMDFVPGAVLPDPGPESAFVPCIEMSLPPELAVMAAAQAVIQNPHNEPNLSHMSQLGLIPTPAHIAVLTTKYWGVKGVRLTVGFMEQIQADLRNKFLAFFNSWGDFANVQFSWSQTDPQVRVTRAAQGYWSYLGTDILQIPRNQPTMSLQGFTINTRESEWHRVVKHEVGHTLGCPHEHMRRDIIARLDVEKTVRYFQQTQSWSRQDVMQQVLTPLDERSLMGSPTADEVSIMTYQLPGSITKDGRAIPGGPDFASQDKEFIAKLYPKAIEPKPDEPKPTEPVASSDQVRLFIDLAKKVASVSCPAGWTVQKLAQGNQESGMVQEPSKGLMLSWAAELEEACGGQEHLEQLKASAPAGAQGGTILDAVTGVAKLVAALKAGNWKESAKALRDLLNILIDESGEVIQFAPQDPAAAIDWNKVGGVINMVLPIILQLLARRGAGTVDPIQAAAARGYAGT